MRDLTVRERKKKKKPVSVNNFRYCNYEDHDLFYVLWLFPIYCAEEVPPPPGRVLRAALGSSRRYFY